MKRNNTSRSQMTLARNTKPATKTPHQAPTWQDPEDHEDGSKCKENLMPCETQVQQQILGTTQITRDPAKSDTNLMIGNHQHDKLNCNKTDHQEYELKTVEQNNRTNDTVNWNNLKTDHETRWRDQKYLIQIINNAISSRWELISHSKTNFALNQSTETTSKWIK